LNIIKQALIKGNFQNNLSHNRAYPQGGFDSRLRVLKPHSGGVGGTLGMVVLGQIILEILQKKIGQSRNFKGNPEIG